MRKTMSMIVNSCEDWNLQIVPAEDLRRHQNTNILLLDVMIVVFFDLVNVQRRRPTISIDYSQEHQIRVYFFSD
jgi:hypothetical protein